MADIDISQADADGLMAMEKQCVEEDKSWLFPAPGERLAIALASKDKRENFMLDITRAQIKLTKATYQNRARQAVILMRLDIDGAPHRNPDDQEIPCPHLHVYREGYGDRWAFLLRLIYIQMFRTCFLPLRRSSDTATSRNRRGLKRGSFHERR